MDALCHAVVMTVENQKEIKKKERDRWTVGGPQQRKIREYYIQSGY